MQHLDRDIQTRGVINTSELGRAIKRKREEMKMSLRAVAQVTGVSASTLSRIENGSVQPDADNLARLAAWLNIPMERVIMDSRGPDRLNAMGGDSDTVPVIYFPQEPTPDIVEAHLRADKNLTPDTARALAELFRVAYSQFSKPGINDATKPQS
ncbi:MAG TPA: helix-turn-helix domain-containing protein [Blastocatellia bacterium]|nr:helix-turn-helix domain-containing protein [Blastocatellia bacterium]